MPVLTLELPAAVLADATARAAAVGLPLADVVSRLLKMYADSGMPGQAGGLKGGTARAKKLTPARRREIGKRAAATRWANRKKQEEWPPMR